MSRAGCLLALVSAALAHLAAAAAAKQPSFTPTGDLPGSPFWSHAYALSPEGNILVGQSVASGIAAPGVVWTADAGLTELVDPPGGIALSIAEAVSSQGAVIAGTVWLDVGPRAFRWTAPGPMAPLEVPEGHVWARGDGVSADGSVVVGASGPTEATTEAFRWTSQTGRVGLGFFPGGNSSSARGVSADGSVVVGVAKTAVGLQEAFRWTQTTGMVSMGSLPGGSGFVRSTALAVSANGSVIVGSSNSGIGHQAFRWNAADGMVGIGAGYYDSAALAVSADGSVIVGTASPTRDHFIYRAVIWDGGDTPRDLKTVLQTEFGLDLTGWTLQAAHGISADGRTICGHGINPDGHTEGWIAVLSDECEADWNGDGQVNSSDIAAFLTSWLNDVTGGTANADFDGSGTTNSSDISAFLTAWLAAVAEPC